MLRIHSFVMGHLVSAVLVGGAAGTLFLDARAGLICGAALLAGAFVTSYLCQWRPGLEAPAWKLWPVAVLANPILLFLLGYLATESQCLVGTRRGWDCIATALALMGTVLCLLPPIGGLVWRWWKRRRVPPPAP